MKYIKLMLGVLTVLIVINMVGIFYLYKEISAIDSSVSNLESKVYSSEPEQSSDISAEVDSIKSQVSDLSDDVDRVRNIALEAESKSGESEDKFHSLCMIHGICDI